MVWNVDYFDFSTLDFKPLKRRAGERGKQQYADCICCFDIETTRLVEYEQSVMYVWQLAIDLHTVLIGRTWEQFKDTLLKLKERLGDLKLVIYDYNLSYEIQFLAGIYHFSDWEVFCTDQRKVLKAVMYKTFEFRCAFRLTNMSLDAAARRYNKVYFKKSGQEFDYTQRRFSDTPLTRKELRYAVNDVLATVEMVYAVLKLNDDSLYSVPLTSTGFVRRNVKQAMYDYHYFLVKNWPDYECYQLLKAAFRGGNTHANRYYTGEILDHVKSVDISSSYPSQQVNKDFPISPFKKRKTMTLRYLHKCMDQGDAVIMRVILTDLKLKNKYEPVPYISVGKCLALHFPDDEGICIDNGRLLAARYVELAITDIDYRLIERQYSFNMEIVSMYTSHYGKLPDPLRDLNIEYFKRKTELKGIEGQELYYFKNKELLNSIYGMSVQDPVKARILFSDLGYVTDESQSLQDLHAKKANVAYTEYQYGIWTTCHAREALQFGIDLCGDNLVYCDTDSCKFLGDIDFSEYNKARIAECLSSGSHATDKHGVEHYMGVYEDDGQYDRFVTLGAKKYAYEDSKGVHITVSGVSKKLGAEELAKAGGLEAFKPGFVFQNSGKTESLYNDENGKIVNVDGHLLKLTRNVVIREVPYTLQLSGDYSELLETSANLLNKVHLFWRNCRL